MFLNNHRNVKRHFLSLTGFTFFEVMVAVAILAFGIVIVSQAFITSLDAAGYYFTHLQAQDWANDKIWEVSDSLIMKGFPVAEETNGQLIIDNKNIDWNIDLIPLDEKGQFFQLNLVLSWREGKRMVEVRRAAYAGI